MREYNAKLFMKKKHEIAEAPFYDEALKRLSWVDIIEGKLYIMGENGEVSMHDFGQMIGAAVPVENGGFIVAAVDGLYSYKDGLTEKICDLTKVYEPYQRSNDAKMDPEGRLWFGSTVFDGKHEDYGNLFSYEDGKIVCRQAKTRLSNGMAWNKTADKFYFSDSVEKKVFVYDYDRKTGEISNRQVLFEVETGVPDGMTIDEDDNLWVAIWGGSKLEHRDGRTGEKLGQINVPAKQVSSCCFYGSQNKLFITTAGVGLEGELDGSLFVCEL